MSKRHPVSATRREIYEADRRRRSLAVAAASTAVVVLALIMLVPLTPGWEKVQKSFFNGAVLAKSFPRLLDAFKVNVMIFAWSAPSIAVLGLLIALARGVRAPDVISVTDFRNDLHGCVSRCAGYFDCLFDRLWNSGLGFAKTVEFPIYLGLCCFGSNLFRLRGRNFPLGHRQRASQPTFGGLIAWPIGRPSNARCDTASSSSQRCTKPDEHANRSTKRCFAAQLYWPR